VLTTLERPSPSHAVESSEGMAIQQSTKPPIVQYQLKLKLRPAQERQLRRWLWHLTGVYNWAIRKIELDARHGVYWSEYELKGLLTGHSQRLGIPLHTLRATAATAHDAWRRCFRRQTRRPRLKGRRKAVSGIATKARRRSSCVRGEPLLIEAEAAPRPEEE